MTTASPGDAGVVALGDRAESTYGGTGGDRTLGTFTGWVDLLRLVLRRDRIQLLIWIAAVAGLVLVSAVSIDGLYPTQADRDGYAALVDGNAAVVVQAGPGYGLDSNPSLGSVLMNETSMWTIILVGIMSIFLVTRHTRAEEETDRAELLRSSIVGRHAAGASTMAGALVANLAAATAVTVGLLALGFEVQGTAAFACALVASGMVFASVTLVCAQIASTGRTSTGLAMAALGLSFGLRAVGDVTGNGMSWLSPIGWGQAIRAFADERWWVLVIPVTATVALTASATALAAHRDFGAGMLPQRAGREAATPWLSSVLGLAVRLQRGAIFGWCIGVALFGVFYGAIANEAEKMVADNPDLEAFFAQAGGASITEAFLASAATIVALLATGFAISAVLRLNGEEVQGRVESLLAAPVSRVSWASSHLLVALAGLVLVTGLGGIGLGVGAAASTGDGELVGQMVGAMLAFVPAIAVLATFAFLLWAQLPRFAMLAWAALAWTVVVGVFGEVFKIPQWARYTSPIEHVPAMPAAGFDAAPLLILAGIAVVLALAGFVAIRRRDVYAG